MGQEDQTISLRGLVCRTLLIVVIIVVAMAIVGPHLSEDFAILGIQIGMP